jgi:hypothetical protein
VAAVQLHLQARRRGRRQLPALGKLRDRYVLELDHSAMEGVDRRLVVAFAVALDALQDR